MMKATSLVSKKDHRHEEYAFFELDRFSYDTQEKARFEGYPRVQIDHASNRYLRFIQ